MYIVLKFQFLKSFNIFYFVSVSVPHSWGIVLLLKMSTKSSVMFCLELRFVANWMYFLSLYFYFSCFCIPVTVLELPPHWNICFEFCLLFICVITFVYIDMIKRDTFEFQKSSCVCAFACVNVCSQRGREREWMCKCVWLILLSDLLHVRCMLFLGLFLCILVLFLLLFLFGQIFGKCACRLALKHCLDQHIYSFYQQTWALSMRFPERTRPVGEG